MVVTSVALVYRPMNCRPLNYAAKKYRHLVVKLMWSAVRETVKDA